MNVQKGIDQYFATGFLIPKGWKAMPLFRNIHHNAEYFPEPQKFNPSRFEVCLSEHFMSVIGCYEICTAEDICKQLNVIIIIIIICK